MKKEYAQKPEQMQELWPGELEAFSWQEFVAGIPAPLFVATSYKANGKENACLQSWSAFVGDQGEYLCILGAVSKAGHLLQTLRETGCCVLNFPTREVYDRCLATVDNNGYEDQEITKSGLTAEPALSVRAPRIRECFLNIECEVLWEREHFPGSGNVTVALKATHLCMDASQRYGKDGYLFNLHSPRDPETGEAEPDGLGAIVRIHP